MTQGDETRADPTSNIHVTEGGVAVEVEKVPHVVNFVNDGEKPNKGDPDDEFESRTKANSKLESPDMSSALNQVREAEGETKMPPSRAQQIKISPQTKRQRIAKQKYASTHDLSIFALNGKVLPKVIFHAFARLTVKSKSTGAVSWIQVEMDQMMKVRRNIPANQEGALGLKRDTESGFLVYEATENHGRVATTKKVDYSLWDAQYAIKPGITMKAFFAEHKANIERDFKGTFASIWNPTVYHCQIMMDYVMKVLALSYSSIQKVFQNGLIQNKENEVAGKLLTKIAKSVAGTFLGAVHFEDTDLARIDTLFKCFGADSMVLKAGPVGGHAPSKKAEQEAMARAENEHLCNDDEVITKAEVWWRPTGIDATYFTSKSGRTLDTARRHDTFNNVTEEHVSPLVVGKPSQRHFTAVTRM